MKAVELFQLNIQRAEKLLDVHKKAYTKGRPKSGEEGDDLLRAVVVFAVSALDAYMRMRVVQVVNEIIYKKKKVPERSITYIERTIKEENRSKEFLNIAISKNPNKKIIQLLRTSLAGVTFQKPEQIEKAFHIMNVKNPWSDLDKLMVSKKGPKKKGRKQSCKTFFSDISSRRDDIVHEGDVYVSPKYHGKLKSIGRKWVNDSVEKLKKVIIGIESVTSVKP